MALVVDRKNVQDPYQRIGEGEALPPSGAVLVSLAFWQDNEPALRQRQAPLGIILRSDEHPEPIAAAIDAFDLIALEFPTFRDGRAYSYARLLRERYGFSGELRAVGDVLLEQLHYLERVGFNAFDISGDDPLGAIDSADRDFTVWYQPSGDGRLSAAQLRAGVRPRD